MKCKNCGGTDFVVFNNHYECTCCGAPLVMDDDSKTAIVDSKATTKSNKLESLVQQLMEALTAEKIDDSVGQIAQEVLGLDKDNVLANFVVNYLDRDAHPDNYKAYIAQLIELNVGDVEGLLFTFIINHSEYKFFDSIYNTLMCKGLYTKYKTALFDAKKRIEAQEEVFADVPRDVFVCYSSNDLDFVKYIVEKIEKDGCTVWFADRNMPKNSLTVSDYKERIDKAIAKCKIFLVVTSANAMYSDDVKWELAVADKYGVNNRIEYRIEDVQHTTQFKVFFDGIQWIDAAFEPQEALLLGRIDSLLHPSTPQEQTVCDEDMADEQTTTSDDSDKSVLDSVIGTVSVDTPSQDDVANVSVEDISTPVEDISVSTNLNDVVIELFQNGQYEEAFRMLDSYDALPDDTENLVYCYIAECFKNGWGTEPEAERVTYFYDLAKTVGPYGSDEHLGLCFFKMGYDAFVVAHKKMREGVQNTGDEQCASEAFSLLQLAAQYDNADAIAYLGICYKNGLGVGKSDDFAFDCFKKSAEKGSGEGAFQLGKCYEKGLGTVSDEAAAFKAYQQAADLGNVHGMVNVGVCYYYGRGTAQSYQIAARYYQQAADLGNAIAQYNLAQCYLKGNGVPQDKNLGYYWMQQSAAANNQHAIQYLQSHPKD